MEYNYILNEILKRKKHFTHTMDTGEQKIVIYVTFLKAVNDKRKVEKEDGSTTWFSGKWPGNSASDKQVNHSLVWYI